VGQDEVEHHGQRTLPPKHLKRSLPIARDGHGVVLQGEDAPENLLHARIVFDNENGA